MEESKCFFCSHISSVSNIRDGSNIRGIWNLAWLWKSDRKNILSPEVSQFVLTSLTESRFGTPQSHFECCLPTKPTHKFTLPSVLKYGGVRTIYSTWQGATSQLSLFWNLQFRGNEFLPLLASCKSLARNDKNTSQQCNGEIFGKLLGWRRALGVWELGGSAWAVQRSTWRFTGLGILWGLGSGLKHFSFC